MKSDTHVIEVTAKDIKAGQCALWPPSKNCAIARALRRHFKVKNAEWGYVVGYIGVKVLTSLNPDQTRSFVKDHDNKKTVRPFKFTVRVSRRDNA